ncbi:putative U6 snRNA-associated Sm-like protein [Wickerhamomyces ciferrii]|uniref:U6 snRNA-associated Sm-like protein n=1 Tax=Wickerhamomyces ciferrii (strain ATCC 14091 / BCRC 22168 / CBS 111 / JCM 3599 / NBRC 0793 / NRRL Y-1031 F-60-10) TaxID=1206466 RepID=K0KTM1_WICCF|nr:putative U6 snRNA-associated Sm-like protein [Wickerhamomyces ciferrii]CCH44729.1 putative U6 snRNA-associated Sm-like protein [Wickerhamomyces ciferrii]
MVSISDENCVVMEYSLLTCGKQLPLYLLTAAKGQPTLVELKSGETINGVLTEIDNLMNLTLTDVIETSPVSKDVKYLRLPEELIGEIKQRNLQNQEQRFNRNRNNNNNDRNNQNYNQKRNNNRNYNNQGNRNNQNQNRRNNNGYNNNNGGPRYNNDRRQNQNQNQQQQQQVPQQQQQQ